MKVLLFEYITGGGLATEPIPRSLAREGGLMLKALIRDLQAIDACHLLVPHDSRIEPCPKQANLDWFQVSPERPLEAVWKSLLEKADAVWPIAPESRGILQRLCQDVVDSGKILLNSAPEAVALTASKFRSLRHLKACGIDVLPCGRLAEFEDQFPGPWVVKPDDGAGCEGSRILKSRTDLEYWKRQAPNPNDLIQPLIEGEAMSLSMLCKEGDGLLLSCNRQEIERVKDGFFLRGCMVNIALEKRARYEQLAAATARAIPGLFGYVGLDFLLVEGKARVLEVNPRLTTSYAVLSDALERNVAAHVLELIAWGLPKSLPRCGRALRIDCATDHEF